MMISDNERREVARRLRELHPEDRCWWGIHGFDWYMFADDLLEAIGFDKDDCNEWTERLADLVEPPTQCPYYRSDRHYCSIHDVPAIDRDALLALADEMDAYSGHFSTGLQECTVQAWAVAIRDALGVSE